MKDFFKMMFASTIGVFIALFLVSLVFIFSFIGIIISSSQQVSYAPTENTVLEVDLSGTIVDRTIDNPIAAFFENEYEQYISMIDIVDAIDKARTNNNIKGIYLTGGNLSAGISSVEAIRKALTEFKENGKFVVAYAGNYTQSAYYLSSVADKIILNPQGMIDLHGLAATPMFYTGLLDKLGVKLEIFKVGTFKSAVEPFMLDKMSDANREQLKSYMGSLWYNVSCQIAESRNIEQEKLNQLVNEGLVLKESQYLVASGLIDTLMYSTGASDYIKGLLGTDLKEDLKLASVKQISSVQTTKGKSGQEIAVLFAEGEITNAQSGAFETTSVISDKEYVKELRKLKDNNDVKAVVFRVNSPGGSAYMSEQIWKEVTEVKKVKPIIVSMGDYAASGGYYISCGADWIVAEPTTITGSIGIFGMFPVVEGLMNKIGISSDTEKTNKFADLGNISRPINSDEKALLQNYIEKGYDTFLSRCAEGRNKTKAEIDSIAQGRVWTGEQALKIGLVDELGGLNEAIGIAAKKANLGNYAIVHYPEKKDFFTILFEESMGEVKNRLLKSILNDAEFRHFTFLNNMKTQDNVWARLPFDVEIK